MRYGDIIEICPTNVLFTREHPTADILNQHRAQTDHTIAPVGILNSGLAICIEKSGRILTEKFLRGMTSTIVTGIRRTIQSRISNLGHLLGIIRSNLTIGPRTLITWPPSGPLPLLGIGPGREEIGIGNTPGKHTKNENPSKNSVPIVVQGSPTLAVAIKTAIARTNANRRGGGQVARITNSASVNHAVSDSLRTNTNPPASAPVYALRVDSEPNKYPVYNLTVSGVPEFYANGILVHNCMDAARYGIYTHCSRGVVRMYSLRGGDA
jgi:hypothetical protein